MSSTGGLHQSSNIQSMRHETAETTVSNPKNKLNEDHNRSEGQEKLQHKLRTDQEITHGAMEKKVDEGQVVDHDEERKHNSNHNNNNNNIDHLASLIREDIHEKTEDRLHQLQHASLASDLSTESAARHSSLSLDSIIPVSDISSLKLSDSSSSSLHMPSMPSGADRGHSEFPTETAVFLNRHKQGGNHNDISELSSAHEIPAHPQSSSFIGGLFDSIKGAAASVSHAFHLDGTSAPAQQPHAEFPTEVAVLLNRDSASAANIQTDLSTMDSEVVVERHPEKVNMYEVREVDSPSTMHALKPTESAVSEAGHSMVGKLHELMNAPSSHKEFGSDLSVLLEHNNNNIEANSTRSA